VKYLIFLLIIFLNYAFSANKYLDNHSCDECHEKIYSEFQSSRHSKGYFNDELHRKVADKVSRKKYSCATCHMPMADNIKALISGEARPNKNNKTHTDGVSCFFCHTVAYVKTAHKFNINTKARQAKGYKPTLYGRLDNPDESDKHSSVSNPVYAQKVCMGCHSHKQNLHKFDVCTTDMSGTKNEESNCITCHMPKIAGTATTIKKTKTHAFHGFSGARNAPEMLSKYVDLKYKRLDKGFEITVHNNTPHPLMSHPLRVVELRTTLKRDGASEALKEQIFIRVIGTEGKPSMPWLATQVIKDTMLKANEKRVILFDKELKSGDEIEVVLGYRVVNEKVAKKLSLDKKMSKFISLKSSHFKF